MLEEDSSEPPPVASAPLVEEEAFVVRHFAGNVCYMSVNFMEKNNDTLHPDFEAALSGSSNGVIKQMFEPKDGGKATTKMRNLPVAVFANASLERAAL